MCCAELCCAALQRELPHTNAVTHDATHGLYCAAQNERQCCDAVHTNTNDAIHVLGCCAALCFE
eukprot:3006422-Lingulodinium_polyedra.AAC.1